MEMLFNEEFKLSAFFTLSAIPDGIRIGTFHCGSRKKLSHNVFVLGIYVNASYKKKDL